ncbi:TorF family putative porin [Acidovorax sp.]|uniref:TorF family putative porin n=1 Tax=Acidovorax sp. TaxID=1872122 RepID=UPI00261BBA51|nr:TorF family putative porin [Acidovorax sp.]
MKRAFFGLACTACLVVPILAQAETTYNIGAVSVYKFRGVDLGNPKGRPAYPALQGGVDTSFDNGFYIGNWNSTGKFNGANLEVDFYGGHRGKISEAWSYDVGVIAVLYPGNDAGLNGREANFSAIRGPLTVMYNYGLSGFVKKFQRLSVSYVHSINEEWKLQTTVGVRNRTAGKFTDYSVGVTRELGEGLSAGVAFSGTTRKAMLGGIGDDRLVLSVLKNF